MENQFVPFALEVKLKELGCHYSFNTLIRNKRYYVDSGGNDTDEYYYEYKTITGILWQQAFYWFREKYNRHIETLKDKGGRYYIFDGENYIREKGKIMFFNTYEEARLACLEKLIELTK